MLLLQVSWLSVLHIDWYFVEFELSEQLARENKMVVVQNKVICLAKKYGTNDKFFPLSK